MSGKELHVPITAKANTLQVDY